MDIKNIKKGMPVQDSWFSFGSGYDNWGHGVVIKVLKTRVHIDFAFKKGVVYDKPHLQFLEVYNAR